MSKTTRVIICRRSVLSSSSSPQRPRTATASSAGELDKLRQQLAPFAAVAPVILIVEAETTLKNCAATRAEMECNVERQLDDNWRAREQSDSSVAVEIIDKALGRIGELKGRVSERRLEELIDALTQGRLLADDSTRQASAVFDQAEEIGRLVLGCGAAGVRSVGHTREPTPRKPQAAGAIARALGVLVECPGIASVRAVAEKAECHWSTLYNAPRFMEAWTAAEPSRGSQPRSGYKRTEGRVDAID